MRAYAIPAGSILLALQARHNRRHEIPEKIENLRKLLRFKWAKPAPICLTQLYRKLILHASIRNFKVHTISEQIRINTGMNLMVKISFDRFLIIFYFFFVLKN